MFEALDVLPGLRNLPAKELTPVLPEPQFKPFKSESTSVEPTPLAFAARTLQELGVDGSLAKEMELVLRLLGHTNGEDVVAYLFRTPDGTPHTVKLCAVPAEESSERAA